MNETPAVEFPYYIHPARLDCPFLTAMTRLERGAEGDRLRGLVGCRLGFMRGGKCHLACPFIRSGADAASPATGP